MEALAPSCHSQTGPSSVGAGLFTLISAGMPVSPAYRPRPLFSALGPDVGDPVTPARFPQHIVRWRHQRWASRIGLQTLTPSEFEDHFARFAPLPANQPQPIAMRYHGHQFRTYNPDIGDGRGFLFAQVLDDQGRLLDLAAKGSGQTPFSRFGDGRLTLKGGVREILASHMLEAQGVYTSKAFALFETGEALQRQDEPSPTRSAVLTRLSHSHLRFGVFQRHAYHDRADTLALMLGHAAQAYYPHLQGLGVEDQAAGLLEAAVAQSARLCGQWMAAGFVHGVLNTDNLVITGESFDYGPWRFLPESDPGFTAAYFDHSGLYAFGRQPQAVGWNLAQLAGALLPIAREAYLAPILERYASAYSAALRDAVFARLGLAPGPLAEDLEHLTGFYEWLTASQAGWEQVMHDWVCGEASAARALAGPLGALYAAPAFGPVRAGLFARPPVRAERLAHPYFQRAEPVSLVIGVVEAVWAAIAEGDDWGPFEALCAAIDDLRDALDLTPVGPT
jgi:serine/tyrosine/threonine adenylyltransferase